MPEPAARGPRKLEDLQPVNVAYRNPWFSVVDRGGYFTVEPSTEQVIVAPIVEGFGPVMVKVIRPIVSQETWELPAGGAEPGESAFEAARRELMEETGILLDVSRFSEEPSAIIMPSRFCDPCRIFSVSVSMEEYERRAPHDHEIAEVALFPWRRVVEMIRDSSIRVTTPVAILSRILMDRVDLKL